MGRWGEGHLPDHTVLRLLSVVLLFLSRAIERSTAEGIECPSWPRDLLGPWMDVQGKWGLVYFKRDFWKQRVTLWLLQLCRRQASWGCVYNKLETQMPSHIRWPFWFLLNLSEAMIWYLSSIQPLHPKQMESPGSSWILAGEILGNTQEGITHSALF